MLTIYFEWLQIVSSVFNLSKEHFFKYINIILYFYKRNCTFIRIKMFQQIQLIFLWFAWYLVVGLFFFSLNTTYTTIYLYATSTANIWGCTMNLWIWIYKLYTPHLKKLSIVQHSETALVFVKVLFLFLLFVGFRLPKVVQIMHDSFFWSLA